MKANRIAMWLLSLFLGIASMNAQQFTIKGEVLDETGEPLTGASVRVKGTPSGIITDIDGNFAISVKKGDILSVSYIGYMPQEITITGDQNLKIVLKEDSQTLEEVVVVGYGTMRKKDLTGAVVQIKPDQLADQNPGNVQELLRGTAGLQIGYDASAKGGGSIQLRGQNSVRAANKDDDYVGDAHSSPLIVLDGMIFYGELSEINPDDIAQIDVLKDASSTAVYGARAAAGVIIITTKKGKMGKPVINVSANLAINTKSDYNDFYDAEGYLRYHEDWRKKDTYGLNPETGKYEAYVTGNVGKGYFDHPSRLGKYGVDEATWMGYGANPGQSAEDVYIHRLFTENPGANVYANYLAGRTYDWNKNTFRTGLNQDYNASISGASERMNYYLSFGYLNNEGAVRGNDYYAFRSNIKLSGKVTDWLEIGANVNFQDRSDGDIQVNLGSNYWDANQLRNSPFSLAFDETGAPIQYPMGADTKYGHNYFFERNYYDLEKGYTTLNSIITANVYLPLGFTYRFNIAPRYQHFYNRYFMSHDKPDSTDTGTGVDREWSKSFDWALNNTITWDRYFKENMHHVIITLVQEAEDNRYWQDKTEARNIKPSDALGFHNTSNATLADSKFWTTDTHYTADALMARGFYSYDDRYMITATVRRDGYSAFGKNKAHATFPSVALGWVFTNEKFWKGYWMNSGKLRLSWGKNGNRQLKDPYLALANLGSGQGGTMTYLKPDGSIAEEMKYLMMDRLANKDLQWESTESWNAGLDLAFLNQRISASIDVYHKATTNMILPMSLPGFSGFGRVATNLGKVTNDGFELTINSTNIRMKNFEWNTTLGFSYNRNRIRTIKGDMEDILDADGNVIGRREQNDLNNKWYIGKPIGEIWDYKVTGIWQADEIEEAARYGQRPGDPKVANLYTADDKVNADGTVTPVYNDKDKVYLGTTNPPIYWSLRNNFKLWQNFDVAISLYSYMGHKSLENYYLNGDNGGSLMSKGYNTMKKTYWTPENPSNTYARLDAKGPSGATGAQRLHKRDFIRLDNISLGYTLPTKWTNRVMLDRVRFSFGIRNVCTWARDWEYGDPETGGLATRTYTFGLNITL